MKHTPLNLYLADDDTDDCFFFKEALEELPIKANLTILNDGEQLMKSLIADGNSIPDVLYLDLNMPRKNGFDCLNEIRRNVKLQHLPVIIFSTSFDMEVINQVRKSGANLYICKPAEFESLKKTINKSINLISGSSKRVSSIEDFVITA
jgi:CheY-like chemotaxis protein